MNAPAAPHTNWLAAECLVDEGGCGAAPFETCQPGCPSLATDEYAARLDEQEQRDEAAAEARHRFEVMYM